MTNLPLGLVVMRQLKVGKVFRQNIGMGQLNR